MATGINIRNVIAGIFATVLSLLPMEAFLQTQAGGYASRISWTMGEPTLEFHPAIGRVVRKEHYDKVTFVDERGKKVRHPEQLWGIVFNDTLYLNIDGRHFVRMKELGAFCYFTGPQYASPEEVDRVGQNTFLFGAIVGGITAAGIEARNKGLYHYVLNSRTGVIHILEPSYMRIVLGQLPDLEKRFEAETDKANPEVMVRYIHVANQSLLSGF